MSAPPSPDARRYERVLAALQAASLSFLLTTFWCGIAARSSDYSFWTFPNLMAGAVIGSASLRPDFGFHTAVGLSLHYLTGIGFGVLYALAVPASLKPISAVLLGILAGSWWYYLLDGFVWRKLFPPLALYSRRPSIFFAFVLMGICIGLYSVLVRSSNEAPISA